MAQRLLSSNGQMCISVVKWTKIHIFVEAVDFSLADWASLSFPAGYTALNVHLNNLSGHQTCQELMGRVFGYTFGVPAPTHYHYGIGRVSHKSTMAFYGQDSYTLTLCIQSAQNLSTHTRGSCCTAYTWSNSSPGGPTQSTSELKFTSFSPTRDNEPVVWNEELQLTTTNPRSEVLTIQVKDVRDALVGSCNIYLAHLHQGQALDQWFQLHPTGEIHLRLILTPNQPAIPTTVPNSPYSADFQALLDLQMKKRAAAVNESPLPSQIAVLVEAQNQAQQNAMLMLNQQLRRQQQITQNLMQSQLRAPFTAGYPAQQPSSANFHEMMGTAANISTIAANMQQLNGTNNAGAGTTGVGAIASLGLGALGLGPLGGLFGS